MTRNRKTVKELAKEARLDVDEVLFSLWETGYKKYQNLVRPEDWVNDISYARRSLGIATRRELNAISYWMAILDLSEAEFRELLSKKLAVPIGINTQRLPRKAISRLRSETRRRGINVLTGKTIPLSLPSKVRERFPYKWPIFGHKRDLRWLTMEEVLGIHYRLVEDFAKTPDPIVPPGMRTKALLGSAVFRAQTSLKGTLKYPTVEMSAAALLHAIILDHPFHNGNKRTALVSTLVFLDENGLFPDFDQDEVFKLVLNIAQHRIVNPVYKNLTDLETLAIAKWLQKNCRILKQGDRSISFRNLRDILIAHGCEMQLTTGSHMHIKRTETMRLMHIVKQRKVLQTQILYHGEGYDVSRSAIKKIRKDLHLDDLHGGIDSDAFYHKERVRASDFIVRYRKTLRRLAKW